MDEENASSLTYSLERIATAFERLASAVDEISVSGVRLGFIEGHSLPLRSHVFYDGESNEYFDPLKVQLEFNEDEND